MILFEGKVGGRFVALTRPLGEVYFAYPEGSPYAGGPSMHLAASPDALHWKPFDRPGIRARKGSTSSMKVGGGSPPIRTEHGWLVVYHGVETREAVGVYRSFWALLDLDDPSRILRLEDETPLLEAAPELTRPDRGPDVPADARGLHHRDRGRRRPLRRRLGRGRSRVPDHAHSEGALLMSATWWQRGVIYQVYPRSFQDSDGDGIGDLKGIEARLDYLAELGVDAIWISPIFPSPMADFGYDVADYCDIDPRFGTLADFDSLLAEAHRRGIGVILDFVPNHTSDQHPWFLESRARARAPGETGTSGATPRPARGGPPNNWISDFGGSAWEWDEATGQYYLHAFLKEQPDLNWRNPAVQAAMYDVLRFWFERGVDGFRIDVLWHLIKAEGLPDNPPNPAYREGMGEMHRVLQVHSTDQPEVHAIAGEMRRIADGYGERVLIGEIYLPLERLMPYYGTAGAPGVHLPFNFQLVDAPWNARELAIDARRLRGRAAAGRLAELGARQP